MHSNHFPDCFYRVSVKGLCVVDDTVLLVKEPPALSGQWELPGGGLGFGEDIGAGLEREIEEELSLNVISVAKQPSYVWTAQFEHRREMDWYHSVVLVYQIEVVDFNFTPSDEAEAIDFFTADQLQSLDLYHQSAPLRDYFKSSDFH